MRYCRFLIPSVILVSILAACSLPAPDGVVHRVRSWTISPLSSSSKVVAEISTGSSSGYSEASRRISINGYDCRLSVYGEASVIEERVTDPWFGLLNIEDPSNGISYHESVDWNSPDAIAYVDSLRNRTGSDVSYPQGTSLAVAIEGLPVSQSQGASKSVARLVRIGGFSYTGAFYAGSGGYLTLDWGWLFFGISTGTGIHDSTPGGSVNTAIYHQSITGGPWYLGASYGPITLATGQRNLSDYQFGFWNYEARWNVVSTAEVLFGTTIRP